MESLGPEYLAGFFDGEGAMIIAKNKNKPGSANPSYFMVISLTQSGDPELLWEVASQYSGNVYQVARAGDVRNGKHSRRDAYQWRVGSTNAEKFIRAIYPFVRLKKDQLDVGLRFIDHIKAHPKKGNARMGRCQTPEVIETRARIAREREEMFQELIEIRKPRLCSVA